MLFSRLCKGDKEKSNGNRSTNQKNYSISKQGKDFDFIIGYYVYITVFSAIR